jgi:two-component system response regulator
MTRTGRWLLLVDDSPDELELAARALRREPLVEAVEVADGGRPALDLLQAAVRGAGADALPAVMLLDLKMPGLDGFDVLRAVRSDPRLAALPIVVLTSSGERSDLERCYALGANSYVVKPVDFDDFEQALRHVGRYWSELNRTPKERADAGDFAAAGD